MTKRIKSVRPVEVQIESGYEVLSCPMAMATWRRIEAGQEIARVEPYDDEGKRYTAVWTFNGLVAGSLYVSYDDGGVHFDGRLTQARILVNGEVVEWMHPMERMVERLDAKLRSGSVPFSVKKGSEESVYVATFPPSRGHKR
ncbi:hypothetical protein [Variovorax guangxiensis]|uniref:hypothetical protein n=1 Tax=Variovorax guangxiensis TaxID=1775474 RepID=UPI002854DEAF|nr:hypothetical protein [Variovorax guangxiensis]MDR6859815.1 hypothetical protein [Variovorax guangxiensis]